jgi:integrase
MHVSVEGQYASDRRASSVISRIDYDKILICCKDSREESSYAIRLQDALGLRTNEVARIKLDLINFNINVIKIGG